MKSTSIPLVLFCCMIKAMSNTIAIKQAEELALMQIAERCKTDLYFLCKYVLGYDIIEPKTHGPLCAATRPLMLWKDKERARSLQYPSDFGREEDEGLPTDEERDAFYKSIEKFIPGDTYSVADKQSLSLHQLLALMPRGTLKTSIITIGMTMQFFLNYSEERVLIDSETVTKANGFLGEIKGHFEGNELYRKLFYITWGVLPEPKNKSARWSNSALDLGHRKKARKEPSVDTAGVDQTKNGMHYDLIIFDDLHSEINTGTKEQIEKVITHFKLAYSLLDPGCPVVVVGTRWTYTDLYQYIIDERQDSFNFITRSARATDGELLYPSRLTDEFLAEQRKGQGSYIFSCQYMNDPVDSETAKFRREWFQTKAWAEVEGIPINWYLTIDPGGDGDTSDFAAFVLSGMDYQGNLYVRRILKAKMSNARIVMTTFELFNKYVPKMIVVETLASQGKSIEYTYKEKMRELGIWLPIRYISGRNKPKTERIEALAPKYEFGQVFHIKECPQIGELEDELVHFPKAKNDDVSDAFATVLEVASAPARHQVSHEKSAQRRALLKKLNTPRSPMIGY